VEIWYSSTIYFFVQGDYNVRVFSGAWFSKIQAGGDPPRSVDMSKVSMKLFKMALCLSATCLLTLPAFAARSVNVKATLTVSCPNCQTDISDATGEISNTPNGPYSLQSDGAGDGSYSNPQVQSQILTHNNVYTLDTMNTLVNGQIVSGTRTVGLHFYSPVEGLPAFSDDVLPACWDGAHELSEAVNWSVFSGSSISFVQMTSTDSYPGWARMDFNVTDHSCNPQVNKFTLHWYAVCIAHPDPSTWVVTSDVCGGPSSLNYGTAGLNGQGGKKGQTQYYGDWRMPFQLTLVKQ
jgi:hypothetical protein